MCVLVCNPSSFGNVLLGKVANQENQPRTNEVLTGQQQKQVATEEPDWKTEELDPKQPQLKRR